MIDYSKYKIQQAEPEASSMIETFRAIGYNIETAIADIIDNSISANAKNICINFEWKGGDSGNKDHLIPEQIDQVFVWRKTEQISWRSF